MLVCTWSHAEEATLLDQQVVLPGRRVAYDAVTLERACTLFGTLVTYCRARNRPCSRVYRLAPYQQQEVCSRALEVDRKQGSRQRFHTADKCFDHACTSRRLRSDLIACSRSVKVEPNRTCPHAEYQRTYPLQLTTIMPLIGTVAYFST
jgi:hypothetical protein